MIVNDNFVPSRDMLRCENGCRSTYPGPDSRRLRDTSTTCFTFGPSAAEAGLWAGAAEGESRSATRSSLTSSLNLTLVSKPLVLSNEWRRHRLLSLRYVRGLCPKPSQMISTSACGIIIDCTRRPSRTWRRSCRRGTLRLPVSAGDLGTAHRLDFDCCGPRRHEFNDTGPLCPPGRDRGGRARR